MEGLLEVQTKNIQDLEQHYEGLKVELTRDVLKRKLKDIDVLWRKIDDAHTTLVESTDASFQINHDYFTVNKIDEAFCIYDASVTLICMYLDMLRTQCFIGAVQIGDFVREIKQQKDSLMASFWQIHQNSTSLWDLQSASISESLPDLQSTKPLRRFQINQPLATNRIENSPFKTAAFNSTFFKFGPNETIFSNSWNSRHRLEITGKLFIKSLLSWWPIKRNSVVELMNVLGVGKTNSKLSD